MMVLERRNVEVEDAEKKTTKNTGERDPRFGTRRGKPTTLLNKFGVLQTYCDIDDEDGRGEPIDT